MDREFYTKANVDTLLGHCMKFLIGIQTNSKLVQANLIGYMEELLQFQSNDDNIGVYGTTVISESILKNKRSDTIQDYAKLFDEKIIPKHDRRVTPRVSLETRQTIRWD